MACQAVLGVQWLETLGLIATDYKHLTMSFNHLDRTYTLHRLCRASLQSMTDKELLHLHGMGLFLHVSFLNVAPVQDAVDQHVIPTELQMILEKFAHIFSTLKVLPPERSHDHHIPLQANQGSVSVQPYRYLYYQKTEIEKSICEFLDSEVIRPSNSSLSSLVLLVKKADGTWRFCVDCCALNGITVKDKYPTPVINELLDELHGAQYFSKLDLRTGYHQIRIRHTDIHKTAFRRHGGITIFWWWHSV